jgi:hypothetical protein
LLQPLVVNRSLVGDRIWRAAVRDIAWHFVKRWYPFLQQQQLIQFSSNKNQD